MGSTFTTFPDQYDQTSIFGTKRKLPVYIQFVPGVVTQVINGLDSQDADISFQRIGSIKALPHFDEKGIKKKSMVDEAHRYWPLLRGIQDIPTVGDPVLLCTMGGINYYLGPLNTQGLPCFNVDNYRGDQLTIEGLAKATKEEIKGVTPNFQEKPVKRLQKLLNENLDNPNNDPNFLPRTIHGDLVFEGRHGNSLRLGSRHVNPYIIIQNGRPFGNLIESSNKGSIFAFLEKGSIREHFIRDTIKKDDGDKPEPYFFTLADSEIEEPKRHIQLTYATGLGRGLGIDGEENPNITETIYGYNENQIFQNSDRITINARTDSIFLAAFKHIHMGSGDSMTFSTSNNILMEAETTLNCNIGEKVTITSPEIDLGGEAVEPLVLGDKLVVWLESLIDKLAIVSSMTTGGGPTSPLNSSPQWTGVNDLKQELQQILSEQNKTL